MKYVYPRLFALAMTFLMLAVTAWLLETPAGLLFWSGVGCMGIGFFNQAGNCWEKNKDMIPAIISLPREQTNAWGPILYLSGIVLVCVGYLCFRSDSVFFTDIGKTLLFGGIESLMLSTFFFGAEKAQPK